jgi:HTH-type transcriptional regulator, competence development regulator
MKLGPLVRSARRDRGLNLRDLAADVGVSPSYLSRIESGEHVRIRGRTLERLAQALGLPQDDVYRSARRLPPDVERFVLENLAHVRRSMARRSRLAA